MKRTILILAMALVGCGAIGQVKKVDSFYYWVNYYGCKSAEYYGMAAGARGVANTSLEYGDTERYLRLNKMADGYYKKGEYYRRKLHDIPTK